MPTTFRLQCPRATHVHRSDQLFTLRLCSAPLFMFLHQNKSKKILKSNPKRLFNYLTKLATSSESFLSVWIRLGTRWNILMFFPFPSGFIYYVTVFLRKRISIYKLVCKQNSLLIVNISFSLVFHSILMREMSFVCSEAI